MRCIRCDADNRLRERIDNMGRCKNCGHEFVFEPAIGWSQLTMTDRFFDNALTAVSANNTLFFTATQLYYVLNRRVRVNTKIKIDWAVVLLTTLLIFAGLMEAIEKGRIVFSVFLLIILPGIGIGIAFIYLKIKQHTNIINNDVERERFDTWLARWNSINGTPQHLLAAPETNNLPTAPNPEVTAYSFDRVVVCDRAEIAHLLIANNFHFEYNCAILAIDGYPQNIFATTMTMLRRNSELKIYAIHDCTPQGLELMHRLRSNELWFPDPNLPIIDVGILPRQIIDRPDFPILKSDASAEAARQLPAIIRANLNSAELTWLDDGYYLELESFSPQKLIQILQRSINEHRQQAAIESGDFVFIDNSPGFYRLESFG